MISFKRLGSQGRLGNQLFQYAFLRLTAQRLGVKFYCPKWIGDEIFLLNDSNERAEEPEGIDKVYIEPPNYFGFNESTLKIEDGTDISGWFQTEKYLDKEKVKKWYVFKEAAVLAVKIKYQHINYSKSVGLHFRFGDKIRILNLRSLYYTVPPRYYLEALSRVKNEEYILVFSDEIKIAKGFLKKVKGNIIYIEGNKPYEDLYSMSLCHDFVCSISTLSWWGAWLIPAKDKTVVVPREGPVRPCSQFVNNDFWPDNWIKIKALNSVFEDHRFVTKTRTFLKFIKTVIILPHSILKKCFKILYSRSNAK
ncbi:MAG: alpha-1,2-fucosyltransferase [Candidatus Omnitrophica bacterium]|nr:alpha-1,2-fucosyltransferase [Candidatus Omnitrophota bacterium]